MSSSAPCDNSDEPEPKITGRNAERCTNRKTPFFSDRNVLSSRPPSVCIHFPENGIRYSLVRISGCFPESGRKWQNAKCIPESGNTFRKVKMHSGKCKCILESTRKRFRISRKCFWYPESVFGYPESVFGTLESVLDIRKV